MNKNQMSREFVGMPPVKALGWQHVDVTVQRVTSSARIAGEMERVPKVLARWR